MAAKARTPRDYLYLLIVVAVGIGVVAGMGFYQEEVTGYFRLQGWNLAPVTQASKEFLDAAARGDGTRVARLTGPDSALLMPIRDGQRITGFRVMQYGGAKDFPLQKLVPTSKVALGPPKLVFLEGGSVSVRATIAEDNTLSLVWDRTGEGWKLKGLGKN